jgi:TetR/AcrR family transcriptional repressor of nem operon
MRYDAEHKQKTRKKVLRAAASAIRAEGPHRIGVAQVMADAGLTHGGFYAHFASKEDLIAASIEEMFRQGSGRFEAETAGVSAREGLARYIDFYLSAAHRDSRGLGCPLPYLAADAPRLTGKSRDAFAVGVARLTERLAGKIGELGRAGAEGEAEAEAEAEAASTLAELVGALSLARAEPDSDRSDAILNVSRAALRRRFGLETYDEPR